MGWVKQPHAPAFIGANKTCPRHGDSGESVTVLGSDCKKAAQQLPNPPLKTRDHRVLISRASPRRES